MYDAGVDKKLGWHGDNDAAIAFVVDAKRVGSSGGPHVWHYVLYFEEDKEFDPLVPPYPNEEVAFLKPNSKRPKVSGAQLRAAQAAYRAKK